MNKKRYTAYKKQGKSIQLEYNLDPKELKKAKKVATTFTVTTNNPLDETPLNSLRNKNQKGRRRRRKGIKKFTAIILVIASIVILNVACMTSSAAELIKTMVIILSLFTLILSGA